jgi:hypothetical protein
MFNFCTKKLHSAALSPSNFNSEGGFALFCILLFFFSALGIHFSLFKLDFLVEFVFFPAAPWYVLGSGQESGA